jgi:hypothetical protein
MKLMKFNYSKIKIEKLKEITPDTKIETGLNISDISSLNSNSKNTEEGLRVFFNYSLNYEKDVAKIELDGNLLVIVDSKAAKGILESWKEKKLDEDFKVNILNLILRKVNLKAMELEEELNLPLHIPFPTLRKKE